MMIANEERVYPLDTRIAMQSLLFLSSVKFMGNLQLPTDKLFTYVSVNVSMSEGQCILI